MEQTECSETSAYKIQTPGNYPEENIQHTEQGESLKSRNRAHIELPLGIVLGGGGNRTFELLFQMVCFHFCGYYFSGVRSGAVG